MRQVIITNDVRVLGLETVFAAYQTYWEGGNENTTRAYFRYDFPCFLAYMQKRTRGGTPGLLDITRGTISDWIDVRLAEESDSTVRRRYDALRGFCRWAAASYRSFVDPCYKWNPITVDRPEPKRLSPEIVEALKAAAFDNGRDDFTAWRNRLLIELLATEGLRANEARVLLLGQVSVDRLAKISGKGRHFRSLPLARSAQDALRHYLPLREERMCGAYRLYANLPADRKAKFPLLTSGRTPLTHSPRHYMLSQKTEWRIVHAAGLTLGLDVHPHLLRHEFAHDLMDKTKNAFVVATALGHMSVQTTMRYAGGTQEEIRRAIG